MDSDRQLEAAGDYHLHLALWERNFETRGFCPHAYIQTTLANYFPEAPFNVSLLS